MPPLYPLGGQEEWTSSSVPLKGGAFEHLESLSGTRAEVFPAWVDKLCDKSLSCVQC